jgi:hypothetical protein
MAIDDSSFVSSTNASPTLTVPASRSGRSQDQLYRSPGSCQDCAEGSRAVIPPAPPQWPRVFPGL